MPIAFPPIDISFDDAKLGDLYTKEAYHMLKELEFKAILKRFDGEEQDCDGNCFLKKYDAIL